MFESISFKYRLTILILLVPATTVCHDLISSVPKGQLLCFMNHIAHMYDPTAAHSGSALNYSVKSASPS